MPHGAFLYAGDHCLPIRGDEFDFHAKVLGKLSCRVDLMADEPVFTDLAEGHRVIVPGGSHPQHTLRLDFVEQRGLFRRLGAGLAARKGQAKAKCAGKRTEQQSPSGKCHYVVSLLASRPLVSS